MDWDLSFGIVLILFVSLLFSSLKIFRSTNAASSSPWAASGRSRDRA